MPAADTPETFIERLEEPRRTEIRVLHELVRAAAPELAVEVTPRMLGYGSFHYRYASGREGDTHLIGLASGKRAISLYVTCAADGAYLAERYADRLPRADIGKACVRIRRTADVDLDVVRELVAEAARLGPAEAAGVAG